MFSNKDDFDVTENISRVKQDLLKEEKIYDMILDELGVTWYNKKIYIILLLFFLADGAEMVVLSLMTSKLGAEWDLSTSDKGILGSSVFVGFFLGSLVSGKLSDTKGRKPIFIYGALIVTVFAFLSAFAGSYSVFLVLRANCGFGIGLSIPAAFALTTEVTPRNYRSIVINGVWAFFPMGEVFVILLARVFLDLENGWRYMMAFSTIPCLIAFILAYQVAESPKFYICNGEYEAGFQGIETMISYSDRRLEINENVKEKLVKEVQEAEANQVKANYRVLINNEFIELSSKIWGIFFIVSFVYYGITYILPQSMEAANQVIEKESGDIKEIYLGLIMAAISEIPSIVFAGYLANMPYVGRIRSMAIGFFLAIIGTFGSFFFPSYLSFFVSMAKFGLCLPFNIMNLYICEAYPTKIRSIAVGVANSFTRFGGIVTPFISQVLFGINYSLPFFVYGISSVIGIVCTLLLPYETYNRRID